MGKKENRWKDTMAWQKQLKINQGAWNLMQCQWFLLSFCTLFCRAFCNIESWDRAVKVLTCRREWGTDCGTRGRCWGSPRAPPWRRRWSCRAGGRCFPPEPGHSWPVLKHDTGDMEYIHKMMCVMFYVILSQSSMLSVVYCLMCGNINLCWWGRDFEIFFSKANTEKFSV